MRVAFLSSQFLAGNFGGLRHTAFDGFGSSVGRSAAGGADAILNHVILLHPFDILTDFNPVVGDAYVALVFVAGPDHGNGQVGNHSEKDNRQDRSFFHDSSPAPGFISETNEVGSMKK